MLRVPCSHYIMIAFLLIHWFHHLFLVQSMYPPPRPKALLLHLNRFIVSGELIRKNTDRVKYGKALSLERFYAEDDTNKNTEDSLKTNYNLCAIVRHIGKNANSGHYTADCERMKKPSDENDPTEWVTFDDGVATRTNLKNVMENERNQRSAYMILYNMGSNSQGPAQGPAPAHGGLLFYALFPSRKLHLL